MLDTLPNSPKRASVTEVALGGIRARDDNEDMDLFRLAAAETANGPAVRSDGFGRWERGWETLVP